MVELNPFVEAQLCIFKIFLFRISFIKSSRCSKHCTAGAFCFTSKKYDHRGHVPRGHIVKYLVYILVAWQATFSASKQHLVKLKQSFVYLKNIVNSLFNKETNYLIKCKAMR